MNISWGSTMEAQQLHDSNQLLPRSQYFNTDVFFSILANHFVSSNCDKIKDTLYLKFCLLDSFRARNILDCTTRALWIILYFITL